MKNSPFMLMDLFSLLCAAYCVYTWVRLLHERKLFKNSLLIPKEKSPADCRDESGYIAYLLPKLGILSLVLIAYTAFNIFCDLSKTVLLSGVFTFLPLAVLLGALIWYAIASVKALREYFD